MDQLEAATVIEGNAAAVADAAKKPKARSAPKWETEARDRLKAAIRRYSKPLADLVARDANEGNTRGAFSVTPEGSRRSVAQSYWLDLFTGTTWEEFLAAGGEVSGFRERRWKTVQQMKPGDYLLCYQGESWMLDSPEGRLPRSGPVRISSYFRTL
jgi:hypothetical protein